MKVLLISEVRHEQELIQRILKSHFKELEVLSTQNKNDAIALASVDGPFGFYILDAEIKGFPPDDLGKELLEFTGNRPVIFLGHDTLITDRISEELYQSNEYNDKVLRPFDRLDFRDDLINKISAALNFAKKEEFEQSLEEVDPSNFISMRIKNFYLYNSFPYDIFMEVTTTNYIKIISAHKPYNIATLSSYARKNVRTLFIKKDDQLEYLETEAKKCLKALEKTSGLSDEIILILLRGVNLIHQGILAIGVTPTTLTLSDALCRSIIEICTQQRELSRILEKYPQSYSGIASKSLLTAFIASFLCSKMGWESGVSKRKLIMAAILMDYCLPEETMSKINSSNEPILRAYTKEQLDDFFQHPIKSALMAQQFSMYPDIDYLIENHHETPNRTGFPNQPSHMRITPFASVFNIAQFVAAELDGEILTNQLFSKTIRALNKNYNIGNFKDPLKFLKDMLKL